MRYIFSTLVFLFLFSAQAEEEQIMDSIKENTVVVEPSNAVRVDYQTKKATIQPYHLRRLKHGSTIGVSVGQPQPEDFESNFIVDTFDSVYGQDLAYPSVEIHTNFKRNYSFFSLGVEFNVGFYELKSDEEVIDTTLEVTYVKAGFQLALDNLFDHHPYVVPYGSAGIYTILYQESLFTNGEETTSNNGNTEVSGYGTFGLMFDISWLDKHSATSAYFESGIENTFLFAEGTFLMESQNEQDPKFSGLQAHAGIKVEF